MNQHRLVVQKRKTKKNIRHTETVQLTVTTEGSVLYRNKKRSKNQQHSKLS